MNMNITHLSLDSVNDAWYLVFPSLQLWKKKVNIVDNVNCVLLGVTKSVLCLLCQLFGVMFSLFLFRCRLLILWAITISSPRQNLRLNLKNVGCAKHLKMSQPEKLINWCKSTRISSISMYAILASLDVLGPLEFKSQYYVLDYF